MLKTFLRKHRYIIIGLFLTLVSLGAGHLLYRMTATGNLSSPFSGATNESPALPPFDESTKHLAILLMGYGGAGHDGGYLTDAIQVLSIDFEKEIVAIISIPRDLFVKSPSGRESKINAVITNSATDRQDIIRTGAPALKQVLSTVTGIPIQYFAGVDFVGIDRAIGINLKGIDVEVSETLDDPWYPIKGQELATCGHTPEEIAELSSTLSGFELEKQFPCRYEHLLFRPGVVHMDGGMALKYTRSRHGSTEGDVSRGKRQQEVLEAVSKKIFSFKSLPDLPGFFKELAIHTTTDIDAEGLTNVVPAVVKAKDFRVVRINLSPTNVLTSQNSSGFGYIMIPKEGAHSWTGVHTYIEEQIAEN